MALQIKKNINLKISIVNTFIYNFLILLALILPIKGLAETTRQNQEIIPFKQSVTNTFSFKQLGWDNSTTLNGYKPNYTFYLPIGKHQNPQKATLHLKIAFSSLLKAGTRIDILFNKTAIRHLEMPANGSRETSWDIELPLADLSENWQALKFSAYLSSSKPLCDPNVWIYISPESSLTLTTLELPFTGSLTKLPYPFIDPTAVNPLDILFILPSNPALPEIIAQLEVAMHFGQVGRDSKVNLVTNFIGDLDLKEEKSKANLIFIATFNELLKEGKLNNLLKNSAFKQALDKKAGVIVINQSPFNPLRGSIIFSGEDFRAIRKAVSAFLTPEFKTMASGNSAIVDEIIIQKITKPVGESYETTFKELGYSDQSVSGVGRHQLSYNIPLPNNRIPTNGSVKTLITAPIFANINNSSITVLVNGLKQSSFLLTKEHSAWKTEIDTSAMKPGVNKIDYLIDLHFEHERCSRENYDEVWATIYDETQFKTSFLSGFPLAMLNQLPVPFTAEITVVLPEQMTLEDINSLTKLFFKFGQLFEPGSVSFKFLGSKDITENEIRNQNVIFFGTAEANPWIKFAMAYMPVQMYGNSLELKLPQKQMKIRSEQKTGLLELMPSPWSEGRTILIITGESAKGLYLATDALINDQIRLDLKGNIALINSENSRGSFK